MSWTSRPANLDKPGHIITGAELETLLDQVDDLTDADWTDFTPTWTGDGSNPAIGNGTRTGRYRRPAESDLVMFTVAITMGSTTTYGSGFWSVGYPSSPAPSATALQQLTASAYGYDDSTGTRYPLSVVVFAGALVFGSPSGGTSVSPTVPYTWATADQLVINGFYEPA